MFEVDWLYQKDEETVTLALEDGDLILAPRAPLIRGSCHPEHAQFLAEAKSLKSRGYTEQQIADELNARMAKQWDQNKAEKAVESKDSGKSVSSEPPVNTQASRASTASVSEEDVEPPPITAEDVRNHLKL